MIMRILTIFFILLVREIYYCVRKEISCVKIKGAIIIHLKLKILRSFRILCVQILPGFKIWDIQHLILRRFDTLKSWR